ncbi:hypothetical protein MTBPR1_40199 [Candidatus Terasakiella magnetica]|uniref:Uncharacterized protein n=1 Tax=Candidatus Terasakiella magnetica TaxID=1867952 RepID=A0A1C3RIT5_9PROT|nr:hypothetical protein MTBPR1_40199 [Candidatus Terasakiella magnetica]
MKLTIDEIKSTIKGSDHVIAFLRANI